MLHHALEYKIPLKKGKELRLIAQKFPTMVCIHQGKYYRQWETTETKLRSNRKKLQMQSMYCSVTSARSNEQKSRDKSVIQVR